MKKRPVIFKNNEMFFVGKDLSDTILEYESVPEINAASMYYMAHLKGSNAVNAFLVARQDTINYNNSIRAHNERVLAARAEKASLKVTNDALPTKSKKPQTDLSKQQVISAAGDTIPIIFCKRVNTIGGAWVQPPMIKTGTNNFIGSFLYVISQGEMDSNPNKHYSWVGTNNIKFLADQTITLTHYYESIETLESAINTCPITSGNIYCDLNSYSYILANITTGNVTYRLPDDIRTNYWRTRQITYGTGDVTNARFQLFFSDLTVYDNITGADITTTYLTNIGITNPASTKVTFISHGAGQFFSNPSPFPTYNSPDPTFFDIFGSTGSITYVYENITINNQFNVALPVSTGTLTSIRTEIHISKYSNPNAPLATADYTNFADITFLEINGNIYDPPTEGSFPTSTKQISLYYDNGINVDLYSGGLISGQYANGPSNQFVDLAMHLFTLIKRANGSTTSDIALPMDVTNFTILANFCTNTGLLFNGIVDQSINIIDYISKTAPFFLLIFISSNGQYSLKPALPLNASNLIKSTALTPSEIFNEANIIPGSFSKTFFNLEERRNVSISLMWREVNPTVIGLQRTTTVRYPTSSIDVITVQYDMTDFCTSAAHAIIYGKYELARRKYSTHSISFASPLLTNNLLPSDIIKVERQRINSVGDNRSEENWYQIINIKHQPSGSSIIQAEHFPVNASNIAIISNEVLNGTFEVI
jgi:hypothetical protein